MSINGDGTECPYCLQIKRDYPQNNQSKPGPTGYAENWSDIDKWKYRPITYRVYDGDTILDLVLDLGFNVRVEIKTRLYGINAPEVRGSEKKEGIKSRDWLEKKMHDAQTEAKLFIESHREQGKFGRWLVTIWADRIDLNKLMVEEGYARFKQY
jgi:micrococcal nuclease